MTAPKEVFIVEVNEGKTCIHWSKRPPPQPPHPKKLKYITSTKKDQIYLNLFQGEMWKKG